MFARMLTAMVGGVMIAAGGATQAVGQVSGRVVLAGGPIGVSVVFGPDAPRPVAYRRVVRRDVPAPVRYRRGMTLRELEHYLERIEYEYDLYRRMHPDDAYYNFGWTRGQLRDYVRWLRDERRFLRDEHKRLRKLYRAERRYFDGRRDRGFRGRQR